MPKLRLGIASAIVLLLCLLPAAKAATPEDDLAGMAKIVLAKNFDTDWAGLEKLPAIKWAPLPPKMLDNCLPDGGCFLRQGTMVLGGRNVIVIASGARSIVSNIYFRNPGAPIGEGAVMAALKHAGFTLELARCPVANTAGGTNWYRLKSANMNPGYFSVQSSCNGKPCEGFALIQGADLPALQPNQLKLYSEKCSGAPAERKAVSTGLPHEALAQALASLVPQVSGGATYDWNALKTSLPTAEWNPGPMKIPPASPPDPYPYQLSGNIAFAQRQFSLLGTGLQSSVRVITIEENGLHPYGENLLGELYKQGYAVKLVRCGPVYTESINNWYAVTSAKSRPVMLRQSIRYDGKRVQDTYELRLDNTLPKRDPRDRDPGVNGCK